MSETSQPKSQPKKKLTSADWLLSVQHLFAMFGATILVPLLTGLNASTALVCAGLGTLIFHLCTKGKVPVFLGSSFAFIPAIAAITMQNGTVDPTQVPAAQGGIMVAGLVYMAFALLVYFIGPNRMRKLFPPVVTGPVIVVIGITLSTVAISDASGGANLLEPLTGDVLLNFGIALITLITMVLFTLKGRGFSRLIPILLAIITGYVLCVILHFAGLFEMDFSPVINAAWINIPYVTTDANGVGFFTLPEFQWGAILTIAPIALVTLMEHIGDITTNSAVVGKDFIKDPGLHRTLLGDGLATAMAGFFGGPPNTTYAENTGVLATTKNYNPRVLELAAVWAILLGFVGKFGAVLQTIPAPVKGGVEIVLFGTIAAVGIRIMTDARIDFTNSRNLTIVALVLICGMGVPNGIPVQFGEITLSFSGLFIAVIVGVLANALLPKVKGDNDSKDDNPATSSEGN